ncbi:phage tail protein [Bartonella tribocorum]|uniref:Phage protein n=1 Tax=Bartonella tribocorum (strain DSM 28219 / CCUG 45778 / CIP 105476 / IBS 506) TaxID=382640 RepID=A9IV54_BART1|nr:phage tail protein [Bartonella tribocorum]CAK01645.1 phage protein [Bartonella tribocorum CIP 105476]CDO48889.1 phage protein [Bartonella tribocorum]
MVSLLLPPNSSLFERCLADAMAVDVQVKRALEDISRAKLITRPPSWLPSLIDEYGLQELTPYFSNSYDLIDQGLAWQRLRGSVAAIELGLQWLGLSAHFTPAWSGRAWWNSFQLDFDQLPEQSSLEAIEAIVDLSKSLRSDFRRSTYGYDVGAIEGDMSHLDDSMLDFESGVRLTARDTLFSFGRTTEINHTLTKQEGKLIGNWIDDFDEELSWNQIDYPWDLANFPWCSVKKHERDILMAEWFQNRPLYLALRDLDNTLIGFRRCSIVQPVEQAIEGAYSHCGNRFNPSPTGTLLFLAARTDFEDVEDKQAASVSLLVHGSLAEQTPLGKLWLGANELRGGVEILKTPINIPLRADVREQFKILLRF